jgi:hypothetical protein
MIKTICSFCDKIIRPGKTIHGYINGKIINGAISHGCCKSCAEIQKENWRKKNGQ